jgi:hypothetical protein
MFFKLLILFIAHIWIEFTLNMNSQSGEIISLYLSIVSGINIHENDSASIGPLSGILTWNICQFEIVDLRICLIWDTLSEDWIFVAYPSRYSQISPHFQLFTSLYHIYDRELRTLHNPLFEMIWDNGISDRQTVSSHFCVRRSSTPSLLHSSKRNGRILND